MPTISDLNDDMFHIILSFLPFFELNQVALVSKSNFRMSTLSILDLYHEKYFKDKLKTHCDLRNYLYFSSETRKLNPFYESFTTVNIVTCNFRQANIEFERQVSKKINDYHTKSLTELFQINKPCKLQPYKPFQEIKETITNSQIEKQFNNLKIIMCGEGDVGKTSLIYRLHHGYIPEYVTGFSDLEIYYHSCENSVTTQPIKTLMLTDTAGQEDYDRLRPLSYPYTDLFCVCFDLFSSISLLRVVQRWIPEINHHLPNSPIVLMGCKRDLLSNRYELQRLRYRHFRKPLGFEDGVKVSKIIGAVTYLESSAVTGEGNVSDFAEIISKCHAYYQELYLNQSRKKNCSII